MKNRGLLIAGALVLASIYIFSDEDEPFTETFTLEALPRVLRDRIGFVADGMLVTVSRISKNGGFTSLLSDKAFEAIVLNKLRDEFGLREDWKDKDSDG